MAMACGACKPSDHSGQMAAFTQPFGLQTVSNRPRRAQSPSRQQKAASSVLRSGTACRSSMRSIEHAQARSNTRNSALDSQKLLQVRGGHVSLVSLLFVCLPPLKAPHLNLL